MKLTLPKTAFRDEAPSLLRIPPPEPWPSGRGVATTPEPAVPAIPAAAPPSHSSHRLARTVARAGRCGLSWLAALCDALARVLAPIDMQEGCECGAGHYAEEDCATTTILEADCVECVGVVRLDAGRCPESRYHIVANIRPKGEPRG